MEFKLESVNGRLKNYKEKLIENGYDVSEMAREKKYDDYNLIETIYYDMILKIKTLDELVKITDIIGYDIIIKRDKETITIYDGYLE